MSDQPVSFEERQPDWTKEYIYDCIFQDNNQYNDRYVLRVYSSIDQRSDKSRESGTDAIRTVLLYADADRDEDEYEPVFSEKRTHRTPGWDRRMAEKLKSLLDRLADIKRCEWCNRTMVVRKNGSTGEKFWGCTGYSRDSPDCTWTDEYE